MAKSARKHWAGLTVVTQDAGDLLGSPLGQAVIAIAGWPAGQPGTSQVDSSWHTSTVPEPQHLKFIKRR